MQLTCEVDGAVVEDANTSDLLFGVQTLISYISHAMSLRPGDVIATGTPAGSGHWRTAPPVPGRTAAGLCTRIGAWASAATSAAAKRRPYSAANARRSRGAGRSRSLSGGDLCAGGRRPGRRLQRLRALGPSSTTATATTVVAVPARTSIR